MARRTVLCVLVFVGVAQMCSSAPSNIGQASLLATGAGDEAADLEMPLPEDHTPTQASLSPKPKEMVGEMLTGKLTWERCANESRIGGYDVMFSSSEEPRSRISTVNNLQGEWIVPKNPRGKYSIDIINYPVPFGARYLLIFGGAPADDSIPAVIALFPTPEPAPAADASTPGVATLQSNLASRLIATGSQQPQAVSGEATDAAPAAAAAATTTAAAASEATKQAVEGSGNNSGVEAQTLVQVGVKAVDMNLTTFSPSASEFQPNNFQVRVEQDIDQKQIKGVVSFDPALKQKNGVESYQVWWGSECNVDKKIADMLPEDASGKLMEFFRDRNPNSYERYFGWRSIPKAANVLMIISYDKNGVPLAEPVCKGPIPRPANEGVRGIYVDAKPIILTGSIDKFPAGTNPITHHHASNNVLVQTASSSSSLSSSSSSSNTRDLSSVYASSFIPVSPLSESMQINTQVESTFVSAGSAVAAAALSTAAAAGIPTVNGLRYSGSFATGLPTEDALVSDITDADVPWAPRSASPSLSPVVVPSFSASASPPPLPIPSPKPDAGKEIACDETDASVREIEFITDGPRAGVLSGSLSFRPPRSNIQAATKFSVFFAKDCTLANIVGADKSLADLTIDRTQPHKSFVTSLKNQQVFDSTKVVMVVATSADDLIVSDPLCIPLSGGKCPLARSSDVPACPNSSSSRYQARNPSFSTPGPVDGKLSGKISFDDAGLGTADISKYFLRYSSSCSAQGIAESLGVAYEIRDWTRSATTKTYSAVLNNVAIPSEAKYILIFAADAADTPLGPAVGVPVYGLERQDTGSKPVGPKAAQAMATMTDPDQLAAELDKTSEPVEVMEVSPDDIEAPQPGDGSSSSASHSQAMLHGPADQVTQQLLAALPNIHLFVRRIALKHASPDQHKFRYVLMASKNNADATAAGAATSTSTSTSTGAGAGAAVSGVTSSQLLQTADAESSQAAGTMLSQMQHKISALMSQMNLMFGDQAQWRR